MNRDPLPRGDVRDVVAAARRRGWAVARTKRGHVRLTHPSGALVVTATTASDWRAGRNVAADIRRVERTAHTGRP